MRTLNTRKDWVVTNADPLTPKRLTGFAAAEVAFTCSGTVVTGTTTRDHYLTSGDVIVVDGATPSGYNGTYTIRVTGDRTFTYNVNVPLSAESGASFYAKKPFKDATLLGNKAPQTVNTGGAYIGPRAGDGKQPFPIAAGGEYYLTPPSSEEWDLCDWYLDVANAGDGLVILFS